MYLIFTDNQLPIEIQLERVHEVQLLKRINLEKGYSLWSKTKISPLESSV